MRTDPNDKHAYHVWLSNLSSDRLQRRAADALRDGGTYLHLPDGDDLGDALGRIISNASDRQLLDLIEESEWQDHDETWHTYCNRGSGDDHPALTDAERNAGIAWPIGGAR